MLQRMDDPCSGLFSLWLTRCVCRCGLGVLITIRARRLERCYMIWSAATKNASAGPQVSAA